MPRVKKPKPKPTPEQEAALRAYAAEHGPTWKADLRADWMSARAPGLLQQVRNSLGPAWLETWEV